MRRYSTTGQDRHLAGNWVRPLSVCFVSVITSVVTECTLKFHTGRRATHCPTNKPCSIWAATWFPVTIFHNSVDSTQLHSIPTVVARCLTLKFGHSSITKIKTRGPDLFELHKNSAYHLKPYFKQALASKAENIKHGIVPAFVRRLRRF